MKNEPAKPANATAHNGYWICQDARDGSFSLYDANQGWFGFDFPTLDDAKRALNGLSAGTLV